MPEPAELVDSLASGADGEEGVKIFTLPFINDNADGWGPNNQPEKYKDLPYQKFSKSDRIGKIADWSSVSHMDKKNYKYQPQFAVGNVGQYSYFHDEDESQFTLVDQSKVVKTAYQKKIKSIQNKNNRRQQFQQYQFQKQAQNINPKLNKQEKMKQKIKQKSFQTKADARSNVQIKQREPSVKVKEDWKVIEEIDFSRLAKLSLPSVNEPVDLKFCGSLEYYDKTYDRINTKTPMSASRLKRINRVYHKVTTTDDPIIRSLAKSEGNVFATDSIIATLMCCSRSVYPWDIVVSKVGNKIFLDKRDGSNFDLLTVSETSTDPPQDDEKHINSPNNLALEATYINHNLSQQVLRMNEERYVFPDPNPFIEGDEGEVASVAYRYRKWDLGNGINLIIRSEIDAVTSGPNDEKLYLNIKALNEWDSKYNNGMDWRMKLDSQPGAVLASEIKNNGCKLAKWTVCTLLSGADLTKYGFVSRVNVRATDKHVILGMQQFKPQEFASQIALNMDNAWGIVRCIIDFLNRQNDGKYIIMKDPNKPMIRIYEIPDFKGSSHFASFVIQFAEMTHNLKYFGIPALGEPIRVLLHLGKFDWKDERLTFDSWGPIKPTTKWGQVPVLTTPDGTEMTQSIAIAHYLAKQVSVDGHKLYPDDSLAAYKIDEFMFAFDDVRLKIVPTFRIQDQAEKEAARVKLFAADGDCAVLLAKIEKFVGEKHVVGDHLSLADIWAYCFLNFLRSGFFDGVPKDYLSSYPKLTAIVNHVGNLPAVKEYYSKHAAEHGPMYEVFIH